VLAHDATGGEEPTVTDPRSAGLELSGHVLSGDGNPVGRRVAMAMLMNLGCHVGVLAGGLMGSEALIEAVEAELGPVRSALGSSRPMS
jgi:hypothetical protein